MYKITIFATVFLLLVGVGCNRIGQQPSDNDIRVALVTEPAQPEVGQSILMITITDDQGRPLEDASLQVKGDMSHAGMEPVLAQIQGGAENGVYRLPFEWTMGGDWILTVTVSLPDGRTAEEQFNLSVSMGS